MSNVVATLAADGAAWTVVLVRTLPHPADRVWAALTDPDQLAGWGPFIADRSLTAPGPVGLTPRDVAGGEVMTGRVQIADAPRLLVLEWGADTLRWELQNEDEGAATRLTLRHRFAQRAGAPSYAAGWELCMEALAGALAGAPIPSVVGDNAKANGWQQRNDHYAALWGTSGR